MPLGKVPVLEVDGVKFTHTIAILRYLASRFNLNGSNDLEALEIEGIGLVLYDLLACK